MQSIVIQQLLFWLFSLTERPKSCYWRNYKFILVLNRPLCKKYAKKEDDLNHLQKKWQSVPSSFKPRLWYGAFANIAEMNLIICKNKSSKYEPSYFGCGLFVLSLTIFHSHQQWRSLSSPFCPPCFTGGHIAAGEPAELAEQHLKIKSRHSAIVSKLLLP